MSGRRLEEKIVDVVLRDLNLRSGFDNLWDSLDEDVRADVRLDLEIAVSAVLAREGL